MKKIQNYERNWGLVVIASLMILGNAAILVLAVLYMTTLGWWSAALIAGAITSIWLSVEAIRHNEPAWLLLDLILPN